MTQYTDVMVDIETTGLQPDRHAILQIAAVRFNAETREVDPQFFDKCLTMPAYRSWDEGTRRWWSQQSPTVYNSIISRAEPYADIMAQFQQWYNENPNIRFWAKPTHFDFMFLASYFSDCDLASPMNYRTAKDMNSFIQGLYGHEEVPQDVEAGVSIDGAAHNALNDCFWQLKVLFAHLDNVGK